MTLLKNLYNEHSVKIIAGMVTIAILMILIFAGPAQAFLLNLSEVSDNSPVKGETISFTASMQIQTNDANLPINNFTLSFSGREDRTCIFDINGNILSKNNECKGISITKLSSASILGYGYGYGVHNGYGYNFGYGYGYGYSGTSGNTFQYNVSIDTQRFKFGEYFVDFITKINNQLFSSSNQISFVVLNQNQMLADNNTIIFDENTAETELVIGSGQASENFSEFIVSVNETQEINLSLAELIDSAGDYTLGPNNFTLTRQSAVNYTAEISSGTTISGGASWDGKLIIPTVKTASDFSVPSGNADIVIDMGSSQELNFSSPVKITIGNMAGKSAAWTRGATLNDISTVCDLESPPANINSVSPRECYINEGNDLVIWTYHFTKFAAWTPQTNSTADIASSDGSANNGGCATEWVCSEWNACSDDKQTRTCEKKLSYCYAGEKPEETKSCEISDQGTTDDGGEEKGIVSRITGAVIGALGPTGAWGVIIFILGVFGAFGFIEIKKRKNK